MEQSLNNAFNPKKSIFERISNLLLIYCSDNGMDIIDRRIELFSDTIISDDILSSMFNIYQSAIYSHVGKYTYYHRFIEPTIVGPDINSKCDNHRFVLKFTRDIVKSILKHHNSISTLPYISNGNLINILFMMYDEDMTDIDIRFIMLKEYILKYSYTNIIISRYGNMMRTSLPSTYINTGSYSHNNNNRWYNNNNKTIGFILHRYNGELVSIREFYTSSWDRYCYRTKKMPLYIRDLGFIENIKNDFISHEYMKTYTNRVRITHVDSDNNDDILAERIQSFANKNTDEYNTFEFIRFDDEYIRNIDILKKRIIIY